jgi:hypothetical protein
MKRQAIDPRVDELYNRRLSAEEFERLTSIPVTDEEVASTMELVRWFSRRYPSARERLAYVRRAYARTVEGPTAAPLRRPAELP